jgi:hypothetical protein
MNLALLIVGGYFILILWTVSAFSSKMHSIKVYALRSMNFTTAAMAKINNNQRI